MRFQQLVDYMFRLWLAGKTQTPIYLLGPPGTAKTSTGPALARRITEHLQKTALRREALHFPADLTSYNPEDLVGLPYRTDQGGRQVTAYAPQAWFAPFCEPDACGVLVLDDLPAADNSVQKAARKIALARTDGHLTLGKGVFIIITGNRRQDGAGASILPSHFRNSVCTIELQVSLEEWIEWYAGQVPDLPSVIPAFLKFQESFFKKFPSDSDAVLGSFATPRSWHKLAIQYEEAEADKSLLSVASGLVGEAVASQFMAYVNVRASLVDPALVLENPKQAVPNPTLMLGSPDKMHAMVSGLAETAARWTRDDTDKKRKKAAPEMLMRALAHITDGSREHLALAFTLFSTSKGDARLLRDAMRENTEDRDIGPVVQFLAKTFRGEK